MTTNQATIALLVADHISGVSVEGSLIDELRGTLPAEYDAIRLIEHDGKARSATILCDQFDGTQLQVRCFADGQVGTEVLPTAKVPFVLSTFDREECGRRGNGRITARVHGYWSSDTITLYVDRKQSWHDESATWVATMSHSSGGRDTDQVKDDCQAERNFGAALTALADLGKDLLNCETVMVMEALHRQQMDAYEAKDKANKAAKQALIDADPALGDAKAKAMINLAIAQVKAAEPDKWHVNRAVVTINAPQRGTDSGCKIVIFVNRNNVTRIEIAGTSTAAKDAIRILAAASNRSAVWVAPAVEI